jgi:hypothetical protein
VSAQLQLKNISNTKKYCKMGDLLDFQRGQIVDVRLAGASVTKVATLLKCIQSSSLQGYDDIRHGRTPSAKRNSGQKPKLNERDRRTLKRVVSINHRSTAAKVTAELNVHLKDRFHKNSLMRASQIQHPW